MKKLLSFWKNYWLAVVLAIGGIWVLGALLYNLLTPPVYVGPPKYLQVDGKQYCVDYHSKGKIIKDWVAPAGQITYIVLQYDPVEQNNHANFNCLGSSYAWIDGGLMLQIDGRWYECIALEEGRNSVS